MCRAGIRIFCPRGATVSVGVRKQDQITRTFFPLPLTKGFLFVRYVYLDFDPDVITGFDINTFDLPYVIDRLLALGERPICLGRFLDRPTKSVEKNFSSNQARGGQARAKGDQHVGAPPV